MKQKINKIIDSFTWWLSKKPFILNDEYRIELIYIDRIFNSAKIKITKLSDNSQESVSVEANHE